MCREKSFARVSMLVLSCAAYADEPKSATPIGVGEDARSYAALGAATLEHEGDEPPFDGTAFALEAYGGFRLRDNLSVELSPQSDDDALDLNDIAGSGTRRLGPNSSWDTVTVKAVGDLSVQDWLSWRRDWGLFEAPGYYRNDIDRTVVNVQKSF